MRVPGRVVLGVVVGIICGAKFRALLLGRAVFVEIVELAAGEQFGVGPLAVRFLSGSLNTLLFLRRRSGGLPFRRPLALFRRRRSCFERLAHVRGRQCRHGIDERRDVALVEAERLRRVCMMALF